MLRRNEVMALVGIHHQLGRHVLRAQSMPELKRLRSGALSITIADHHQGGCLYLVDEINRGAPGVHPGIVVDRRSEKWSHPLVDGILSVVALPVGDPGSGQRCVKS